MDNFFVFVAPSTYGPATVGLTREQAVMLRDEIDRWLTINRVIELQLCEICNIYMALLEGHDCVGVM